MHVSIEDALRLHFAEKAPAWDADGSAASWTDEAGAKHRLVVVAGALSAAAVVDAQLARPAGARLLVAFDGGVTDVARRTAQRFGIDLLDAATLPAPHAVTPVEVPVVEAPAAAEPEPVPERIPLAVLVEERPDAVIPLAAPPAPFALLPAHATPMDRPVEPPVETPTEVPVEAPAPAPAPQAFPVPAAGLFAALERPVVVPHFPAPPLGFFAALERPEAAPLEVPAPPPGFFAALERPEVVPHFPSPAEGFFDLLDAQLAAPPAVETHDFPAPPAFFFDAMDMVLVQQALEAVEVDPIAELAAEWAPAETTPVDLEPVAAPEVEADEAPEVEHEPDVATEVEPEPELAPWPTFDEPSPEPVPAAAWAPEPEPAFAAEPAPQSFITPWPSERPVAAADAAVAGAPAPLDPVRAVAAGADEDAVAVTKDEVAAMPWSSPAQNDHEIVERLMSRPAMPARHASEVLPPAPHWGLPWSPRTVQKDGLVIADPSAWNVRERVASMRETHEKPGNGSLGAGSPPASGSAWLRRLQSFGGP